ncbi:3-deoxy-manno-octulosonate-8-phosphatase KdsC [Alteromonas oceanisediminis]|uniref:3-deoxy-manno-octulosonate-8-phosphatase KdsC n=1 Tax=Alteromonas oceanisediminis TaxID=2836180 RepID=UPI001BDA0D9A|nr:3-deoxy-manno-octulosonate-8-phosphatase KdsC [Alteromonas oceanisediminis]MBT0585440.1 3-deoxy-manno-octulosonate-8-phosphatase KdsC [Alteromonas oceanisediminis]
MKTTSTLYGEIDSRIIAQLSNIQLLVCDVDGVFSDGRIYLGEHNEEFKAFHTRDGFGVKALVRSGVDVAIVTGRQSQIVARRMQALNVKYIVQGSENKADAMQSLLSQTTLTPSQVAAVGDDVPDLGLFKSAGLAIAVADAHPLVKQHANWVLSERGGFGAVRQVCDLILDARGALYDFSGASL